MSTSRASLTLIFGLGGRGRPHQTRVPVDVTLPEKPTRCLYEPERWQPDEQKPDPEAVAACWSCHFQRNCARQALDWRETHGIWGGYRLAPGPGLQDTRAQLAIIAGLHMGPAKSPGLETAEVLAAQAAQERDGALSEEPEPEAVVREIVASDWRSDHNVGRQEISA
ncbi:transcription factor WhiB [Mycobacteroides abscessus subsp. abscessus]|nr:WhiB family transcriptional regulator [Mycobacteroides abscessus subsp. massiliense]QSN49823.1 WhiB family transcriptional regulator [Mycobacteroides abscessus subsp. abscessus]SII81655.1 transcription factor WhiB [Mycobacteroides abscessus subsp. abscessus]SIJ23963.1 transcription factor WhiB [Mycobacteroides abscessus subsp. abscessus]SIK59242.1 transcription factor WhiB [Mycobacteroides abscessus subsp. abscessus]